jgi:hypothetical protein
MGQTLSSIHITKTCSFKVDHCRLSLIGTCVGSQSVCCSMWESCNQHGSRRDHIHLARQPQQVVFCSYVNSYRAQVFSHDIDVQDHMYNTTMSCLTAFAGRKLHVCVHHVPTMNLRKPCECSALSMDGSLASGLQRYGGAAHGRKTDRWTSASWYFDYTRGCWQQLY